MPPRKASWAGPGTQGSGAAVTTASRRWSAAASAVTSENAVLQFAGQQRASISDIVALAKATDVGLRKAIYREARKVLAARVAATSQSPLASPKGTKTRRRLFTMKDIGHAILVGAKVTIRTSKIIEVWKSEVEEGKARRNAEAELEMKLKADEKVETEEVGTGSQSSQDAYLPTAGDNTAVDSPEDFMQHVTQVVSEIRHFAPVCDNMIDEIMKLCKDISDSLSRFAGIFISDLEDLGIVSSSLDKHAQSLAGLVGKLKSEMVRLHSAMQVAADMKSGAVDREAFETALAERRAEAEAVIKDRRDTRRAWQQHHHEERERRDRRQKELDAQEAQDAADPASQRSLQRKRTCRKTELAISQLERLEHALIHSPSSVARQGAAALGFMSEALDEALVTAAAAEKAAFTDAREASAAMHPATAMDDLVHISSDVEVTATRLEEVTRHDQEVASTAAGEMSAQSNSLPGKPGQANFSTVEAQGLELLGSSLKTSSTAEKPSMSASALDSSRSSPTGSPTKSPLATSSHPGSAGSLRSDMVKSRGVSNTTGNTTAKGIAKVVSPRSSNGDLNLEGVVTSLSSMPPPRRFRSKETCESSQPQEDRPQGKALQWAASLIEEPRERRPKAHTPAASSSIMRTDPTKMAAAMSLGNWKRIRTPPPTDDAKEAPVRAGSPMSAQTLASLREKATARRPSVPDVQIPSAERRVPSREEASPSPASPLLPESTEQRQARSARPMVSAADARASRRGRASPAPLVSPANTANESIVAEESRGSMSARQMGCPPLLPGRRLSLRSPVEGIPQSARQANRTVGDGRATPPVTLQRSPSPESDTVWKEAWNPELGAIGRAQRLQDEAWEDEVQDRSRNSSVAPRTAPAAGILNPGPPTNSSKLRQVSPRVLPPVTGVTADQRRRPKQGDPQSRRLSGPSAVKAANSAVAKAVAPHTSRRHTTGDRVGEG